ncbi:hypothetical protein HMPREF9622_02793 [Cutibacterium modestum HL037PA3]|nr:hypothetical protein HMPREF9622_02793 [Cutibacterium modestum HL037PA3]
MFPDCLSEIDESYEESKSHDCFAGLQEVETNDRCNRFCCILRLGAPQATTF